jgi:hypothetical protein
MKKQNIYISNGSGGRKTEKNSEKKDGQEAQWQREIV